MATALWPRGFEPYPPHMDFGLRFAELWPRGFKSYPPYMDFGLRFVGLWPRGFESYPLHVAGTMYATSASRPPMHEVSPEGHAIASSTLPICGGVRSNWTVFVLTWWPDDVRVFFGLKTLPLR